MSVTALPPLSYTLAVSKPGGYARARDWLARLRDLGFSWVTLMPTYLVVDEVPLRIDLERSVWLYEVAETVSAAVEAGFHIKLEPHLDFESTLTGGPYQWRRRMYFEPESEYAGKILGPLFGILGEAAAAGRQAAFTLGSELDVSVTEFAPRWEALIAVFRQAHPGIAIGQNINHNSLGSDTSVRKELNAERARRGLKSAGWREHRRLVRQVHRFLGQLDYVGFSFYPDVKAGRPLEWWRGPTTEAHAQIVGRAFIREAQTLISRLRRASGDRPQFVVGETGIGCDDPSRPWHFDRSTLVDASGALDLDAAEVRRKFYLGFLDCLRQAPHLFKSPPVTFWTVAQYDILGALEYPGCEIFRDETVCRAVAEYNAT